MTNVYSWLSVSTGSGTVSLRMARKLVDSMDIKDGDEVVQLDPTRSEMLCPHCHSSLRDLLSDIVLLKRTGRNYYRLVEFECLAPLVNPHSKRQIRRITRERTKLWYSEPRSAIIADSTPMIRSP